MTSTPEWRTSSYTGQNNNCVELSITTRETSMRDTKNRSGGTLTISGHAFDAFLTGIKHHEVGA
jgi:hypothetical protein